MAPPQAVKEKHVRLRVAPAVNGSGEDFTPVSSDAASIRSEMGKYLHSLITSWRDNITFKAMGWGMKESCDRCSCWREIAWISLTRRNE